MSVFFWIILCLIGLPVAVFLLFCLILFVQENFIYTSDEMSQMYDHIRSPPSRILPPDYSHLIGQSAVTHTALKPYGHVLIERQRYEAKTQGEFLTRSLSEYSTFAS